MEETPQGFCLVRFFENVRQFEETDNGKTISGWEYDEHTLEMQNVTETEVLANYDNLLAAAKQREKDSKPTGARLDRNEAAQDTVNSILFVTLAEDGLIDSVTAGEHIDLFSPWGSGIAYESGKYVSYNGKLYRCITAHTSQDDWTPDAAVSIWQQIADPSDPCPPWSQPIGAHDAYDMGARVTYNGQRWQSTINANVWQPGVYGWETYTEGE